MKKVFIALLTFLLIATFSLSAFAASDENYIYEIENVTVVFDGDTTFDATTRELVAHKLVHGDDGIATYGFLCALLGHKYEVSGVTTVTHCVRDTQPRCLEECFTVEACTRCDDTIVTRTGFSYITCCD